MAVVAKKQMASPVCEGWPSLEGRQTPEVLIHRDGDWGHGDKAIELARRFGLRLMPWQEQQVRLALATDDEGRWVHQDVVLVCPRQNGKSLILEVVILYRLFVLHQKIIFTAQRWATAKSIRNRLWKHQVAIQRARSAAVEAAEKAVGVMRGAMDTQSKTVEDLQTRVTDQDKRITDQDVRLTRQSDRITDISQRHTVAIGHIAEREDAAEEYLGDRPGWLPVVPELIRPDVDQARQS